MWIARRDSETRAVERTRPANVFLVSRLGWPALMLHNVSRRKLLVVGPCVGVNDRWGQLLEPSEFGAIRHPALLSRPRPLRPALRKGERATVATHLESNGRCSPCRLGLLETSRAEIPLRLPTSAVKLWPRRADRFFQVFLGCESFRRLSPAVKRNANRLGMCPSRLKQAECRIGVTEVDLVVAVASEPGHRRGLWVAVQPRSATRTRVRTRVGEHVVRVPPKGRAQPHPSLSTEVDQD